MRTYTRDDAAEIVANGTRIKNRRAKPTFDEIFAVKQDHDFNVVGPNGLEIGEVGDYIAHETRGGHVWRIKAEDYSRIYREITPS
jgi:hypothetical protein